MLGERALDLVREAKRSQDMLGPYNEDKVSDLKMIFIQNNCLGIGHNRYCHKKCPN